MAESKTTYYRKCKGGKMITRVTPDREDIIKEILTLAGLKRDSSAQTGVLTKSELSQIHTVMLVWRRQMEQQIV